jgi:hypothetical protein
MVGGLCPGIVETMYSYLELVQKRDFFFFLVLFYYNHITLVKVMGVMIILCVHTFTFLCGIY